MKNNLNKEIQEITKIKRGGGRSYEGREGGREMHIYFGNIWERCCVFKKVMFFFIKI